MISMNEEEGREEIDGNGFEIMIVSHLKQIRTPPKVETNANDNDDDEDDDDI